MMCCLLKALKGDADNGVERSENEAYGGTDNDVLFAGLGLSQLYGGAGHDVLHYDFTIADLALTSEAHLMAVKALIRRLIQSHVKGLRLTLKLALVRGAKRKAIF